MVFLLILSSKNSVNSPKIKVYSSEFIVQSLKFNVYGLWFKVYSSRFRSEAELLSVPAEGGATFPCRVIAVKLRILSIAWAHSGLKSYFDGEAFYGLCPMKAESGGVCKGFRAIRRLAASCVLSAMPYAFNASLFPLCIKTLNSQL